MGDTMSGLDERGVEKISIPKGKYQGRIPDYWMGDNRDCAVLCWLQQTPIKRRDEFDKDLIINSAIHTTWDESCFDKICTMSSLFPIERGKHLSIKKSKTAKKILAEMKRAYREGRWQFN